MALVVLEIMFALKTAGYLHIQAVGLFHFLPRLSLLVTFLLLVENQIGCGLGNRGENLVQSEDLS